LLQIELGDYEDRPTPFPIHLFTPLHPHNSFKLCIHIKPQKDVKYFCNIPSKEKHCIFTSTVEKKMIDDGVSIEIDVYPLFGSQLVGRAIVSVSQLRVFMEKEDSVNGKVFYVPVVDERLESIGEVLFRVSVVKPFVHASMSINGTIETYWKSTTVLPVTPYSTTTATTTTTNPNPNHHLHSLVTSSSLAKEFIEVVCQTTKDHITVVYKDWFVHIGSVPIPIHSLTYSQLLQIFGDDKVGIPTDCGTDPRLVSSLLTDRFFTLREALQVLVSNIDCSPFHWTFCSVKIPY
jgi:hypothetical protein